MLDLDDLRDYATSLPDVQESTHFRLPSFKVHGKSLLLFEKGHASVLVSVDQATAAEVVSEAPDVYEAVWRNGSIFVGVRVNLARVPPERMRKLVKQAWRHRAPRRVVASYDAEQQ